MSVPLRTFLVGPLGGRAYVVCRGCAAHLRFAPLWYVVTGVAMLAGFVGLASTATGRVHPFWWFFGGSAVWGWLCLLLWWRLAPLRTEVVDDSPDAGEGA